MILGTVYSNFGRLADAQQQYDVARRLAGQYGSSRDEARATALLAYILYYRGDVAQAEELALQALEWLERAGDIDLRLQTLRLLARFALLQDDLDLAERRLREILPIALELRRLAGHRHVSLPRRAARPPGTASRRRASCARSPGATSRRRMPTPGRPI